MEVWLLLVDLVVSILYFFLTFFYLFSKSEVAKQPRYFDKACPITERCRTVLRLYYRPYRQ